ncbi:hypothetical protein [Brevibacillus fulvus]|uniref:Uncharacterized protein n=1 Tax=Brevibacillus fulvus TaxID=1125967 RepID=A0A939BU19_9BACL|nr:hypothetical protein [Brevibacillus fulvus]MBM7589051.1 hypothetical protein [Brevibacillus fulvus]
MSVICSVKQLCTDQTILMSDNHPAADGFFIICFAQQDVCFFLVG